MIRRWLLDPVTQCICITGVALAVALSGISLLSFHTSQDALFGQLAGKALIETDQARRRIDRALDLGIPLDGIVGIDAMFKGLVAAEPDIAFMVVSGSDDGIVSASGLSASEIGVIQAAAPEAMPEGAASGQSLRGGHLITRLPLTTPSAAGSHVAIGYDAEALTRPLRDSLVDVGIILLAIMLLSFELMLLVLTVNVVLPARTAIRVLREAATGRFSLLHGQVMTDELGRVLGRINEGVRRGAAKLGITPSATHEPRLVGVRLLAFLFVCAEELARPIMPAYFETFITSVPALGRETAIGMMMGAHMIMVALITPAASMLYGHIGRRHMYAAGALIATLGLLGTAFAQGFWDLLLWRTLSGAGYAITFTACQGFVLESTGQANRSQGVAMMVSGIMLADVCGPAIGGILAARIGYPATFVLGAGLALLAVVLMPRLMGPDTRATADRPPRITWSALTGTLRSPRFVALLFLAAIPSKVLLTGYLYYLVPVALIERGANAAEVGRALMIYGLVALVSGPLFARLADARGRHGLAVAAGGLIAAMGILPVAEIPVAWVIFLGIAALGLGQALSISSQVSVAIDLSAAAINVHGTGPVMGVMRLMERLGGSFGPFVAASLAAAFGTTTAMGLLALYAGGSAILFLMVSMRAPKPQPDAPS